MFCLTKSKYLKSFAATIGFLTLAGCATNPQEAINIAKPKTLPARNLTNFSDSLRCMDQLFLQFSRRGMVITSAGIPDETAVISAGTKDMLISAISRMSRKSEAFTFVDYDATQTDVHSLQGLAGFSEDFVIPDFYIRGAITQLDGAIVEEAVSASVDYDAGFGLPEETTETKRKGISRAGFSASADQIVSVVSLDLNIGDLVTRQIISGMSAHNSIAVAQNTIQGGLGGQISKLGASFNVSLGKAEGLHQAVRTLIELSAIEVLGKLAEVPFWRCLQVDHTNPAVVAEAKAWFDGMSRAEKIAFVQGALSKQGIHRAGETGVIDAATKDAIAHYQAQNDLIADGRINFDLYASLLNQGSWQNVPKAVQSATIRAVETNDIEPAVAAEQEEAVAPLILSLVSDESDGTYEVDRELHFYASVNRDAHIYCYYADAFGNVARVFPNQFQQESFRPAGVSVAIPDENAGFDIILDHAGADERVACLASTEDLITRLPEALQLPDLMPIPNRSIDDIVDAYRDLDQDGVVLSRLDLKVR